MNEEAAKALRAEFPPEAVGKLPRVTCRDCSDKNTTCQKHKKEKCSVCGNWISTAHIHLDFVGHAGVTDRLLKVDPEWTWEPVAFDSEGAPLIQRTADGSKLWIRLTVGGVTRYGVGIASGFELEKQLISDAIRNAAMRFGVALDLWSKEDLGHDENAGEAPPSLREADAEPAHTETEEVRLGRALGGRSDAESFILGATAEASLPPVDPNLLVDAMTAKELHDELERRGLPSSGTKAEMRERLVAA